MLTTVGGANQQVTLSVLANTTYPPLNVPGVQASVRLTSGVVANDMALRFQGVSTHARRMLDVH
jgi:hypothetical protein